MVKFCYDIFQFKLRAFCFVADFIEKSGAFVWNTDR